MFATGAGWDVRSRGPPGDVREGGAVVYKNEGLYANGSFERGDVIFTETFRKLTEDEKEKVEQNHPLQNFEPTLDLGRGEYVDLAPGNPPKKSNLYCMNTSVTDKNANVALVRVPAAKGEGTITVEAKAKRPINKGEQLLWRYYCNLDDDVMLRTMAGTTGKVSFEELNELKRLQGYEFSDQARSIIERLGLTEGMHVAVGPGKELKVMAKQAEETQPAVKRKRIVPTLLTKPSAAFADL